MWVSPNDLLEFSKKEMLEGREPETKTDWILVANCMAFNIDPSCSVPAMQVMGMIYDMPISKEELAEIATFQSTKRRAANA